MKVLEIDPRNNDARCLRKEAHRRRFEELRAMERGGEDEHSLGNFGGGAEEKGMTIKGERGDRDLTHRPTFAASCSADSRCSCVDCYSRTQE